MGINVRMVTGDNITTAKEVAIEAGIATREAFKEENVCLEGSSQIMDAKSSTIASKLKLLARATPDAKEKVVDDLM